MVLFLVNIDCGAVYGIVDCGTVSGIVYCGTVSMYSLLWNCFWYSTTVVLFLI